MTKPIFLNHSKVAKFNPQQNKNRCNLAPLMTSSKQLIEGHKKGHSCSQFPMSRRMPSLRPLERKALCIAQ